MYNHIHNLSRFIRRAFTTNEGCGSWTVPVVCYLLARPYTVKESVGQGATCFLSDIASLRADANNDEFHRESESLPLKKESHLCNNFWYWNETIRCCKGKMASWTEVVIHTLKERFFISNPVYYSISKYDMILG